ncbi:MAG: hypothetical protein CVV23_06610 [Ignavibacteriae bacterium HGW-Ignavibacteriae-2]|jgi:hypothetical protein|nr:hypothetical protein [Bacteroidota bacterium]PKL89162.1 MAG: hypothetical protein CVV23_06610 [Ignavibacteriae bacterium HGW-Ignavibacteriae-2]
MEKKPIYYLVPVLLGTLILLSNFLSTDLFQIDVHNFSVWFVLSLFVFVCGWLINKLLGWKHGGKVVFAVIVAVVIISIIMISMFSDYFGIGQVLTENLLLYSLRLIMLGAIGFFGMTLSELLILQREIGTLNQKNINSEACEKEFEKKAAFLLSEAQLNAEKIVFKAQKNAQFYEDKLNSLGTRLKELIQMEKELIRQYEEEDKEISN